MRFDRETRHIDQFRKFRHRFEDGFQVGGPAQRFEDDEVRVGERPYLFGQQFGAGPAVLIGIRFPDRADRCGDQRLAGGGFTGELHSGPVDRLGLFGQSEFGQPAGVRVVGVGGQDFRSGLEVLVMNVENHIGSGQVQLFKRRIHEEVAAVDFRADRAVENRQRFGQFLLQKVHYGSCPGTALFLQNINIRA